MTETPEEKIDKLLESKSIGGSRQAHEIYANLKFRKQATERPVSNKFEYKVFGVETINLNPFLHMRLWQRSIYVTDKLIRLVAASRLEFLQRYLKKKRTVPFNMIWLLLLLFGVVAVVIIVVFLLPRLGAVI